MIRRQRTLPAVLLVGLAVALGLAVTGPGAVPAGAQPAPRPMGVALELLDAVLLPDEPEADVAAVLRLEARGVARQDLRLVTTVHAPVADRDALPVDADDLGAVFAAEGQPLPDLAAGTTRLVTVRTPRDDLALSNPDRAGVYPMQFQVFQGNDPVGAIVTSLIVLPESGPDPLPATTVIRLDQPAAAPLEGDVARPELEAVVAPDGPGRALATDLARLADDGSAAGTAVVASSRLLADLSAMADGYRRTDGGVVDAGDRAARRAGAVVEAIARVTRRADVELLALPHGPADLVALVRGGRTQQAVEAVVIGRERTEALLRTAVTESVLVPPAGLDAATLAAMGQVDADAVLLDAAELSVADADAMQPVRRLRTADGGEVRMLVPDPELSAMLADPREEGAAVVVQRVLAETVLEWAADGGRRRIGVLLSADPLLATEPLLTTQVVEALAGAPWIRPVGLSTLSQRLRPAEREVRLSYPPSAVEAELDPELVARYGEALAALVPLDALLGEDDRTAAQYAEALLVVPSTAYRLPTNRPGADARIDRVLTHLTALRGGVQVLPSAPITLTAATGEIPVTIVNAGDVAVRVAVQLSSTRFDFPPGRDREVIDLPARASVQLRVPATARNPGGFAAVTVTVTDPAGAAILTQSRISVRSTAFPVVGLLAVVGSALVLVIWGVRQSVRRRRPARHERTGAADADAGAA